MDNDSFQMRALNLLLQIPKGRVTTYQELAHVMETRAYRAVGTAMAKNQFLGKYPCYKVVKSNSEVGQYAGETWKKIELLRDEGLEIRDGKIVDFEKVLFRADEFKV